MFSVIHFTQYLEKKSFEENPARQALYNYLKYVCDSGQALKVEVFNQFYRKALLFYYWQKRENQLRESIAEEMNSFAKCYNSFEWDSNEWNPAHSKQIIKIQQAQDVLDVVASFMKKHISAEDQIQVFPLYLDRVLVVILKKDGRLKTYSFGSLAVLHQGQIEPLSSLSELHYSDKYELDGSYRQTIEDGGTRFIYFYVKRNTVTGYECQCPFFKKITSFKEKKIEQMYNLFMRIKQIESFFIHSQSDPHYSKLVQSLHYHYHQILTHQNNNNDNKGMQDVVNEARQALKDLYPNDHLLVLLLANIEFHSRQQQQIVPSS